MPYSDAVFPTRLHRKSIALAQVHKTHKAISPRFAISNEVIACLDIEEQEK